MTTAQIKLLSKMKRFINMGNKRFVLRKDRNYVQELLDFDITEKEVWDYILSLNANYYVVDCKPNYASSNDSLVFKRRIKQGIAYIKLRIEINGDEEETVCLSFHRDHR